MKPAAFDFVRAGSVAEAARVLAAAGGEARVVAGGQSLAPMLALRLAQPRILLDITGIPDLTRIEDGNDAVVIGACVTTANVEDGRLPGRGLEPLAEVAGRIAYRAVRNRGTVGGSVCHADPAADWPPVLAALGAECLIAGEDGRRRLPVEAFVTGAYETALAPAEVLEGISIPRLAPGARFSYRKYCRKAGEFAMASAAVLDDPGRGLLRLAVGATYGRPIVVADAASLRRGDGTLDEDAVRSLLAEHGIVDPVHRRQQLAAVVRAHDEAAGR